MKSYLKYSLFTLLLIFALPHCTIIKITTECIFDDRCEAREEERCGLIDGTYAGICPIGEVCSDLTNTCQCLPEKEEAACGRLNMACGKSENIDNACGGQTSRTIECGSCPAGSRCNNSHQCEVEEIDVCERFDKERLCGYLHIECGTINSEDKLTDNCGKAIEDTIECPDICPSAIESNQGVLICHEESHECRCEESSSVCEENTECKDSGSSQCGRIAYCASCCEEEKPPQCEESAECGIVNHPCGSVYCGVCKANERCENYKCMPKNLGQ